MRKKIALSFFILLQTIATFSQNAFMFGNSDKIFTYDTSLTKYGEIYKKPIIGTYGSYLTSNSYTKLLAHTNGKIYGVATNLHPQNPETKLFYFDTTIKKHVDIISMDNNSQYPKSNVYLTKGPTNLIYGSSIDGGSFDNKGTIFSIDPSTNQYKQEAIFTENLNDLYTAISFDKYDSLMIISYLYGGPKNKGGCEFVSTTTGNVIKTIYFGSSGNTAGNYVSGLLNHPNGWLYGVNAYAQDNMRMFMRINPITGYAENMVNENTPYLGPNLPVQKLILGSNGNIYGTDRDGGLFSYDVHDDSVINKSYSYFYDFAGFTGNFFDRPIERQGKMYHILGGLEASALDLNTTADNSLSYPGNVVIFHSSLTKVGNEIYFSAFDDWLNYPGHISKYDTVANQLDIVYTFTNTLGESPQIIRTLNSGLMIGITKKGGTKSSGVVFTFNTQTLQYNVLYNLDSLVEGRNPLKEIIELQNGDVLFATKEGALYGDGAVIKLNVNTQIASVIKNFKHNGDVLGKPAGEMVLINNSLYGLATSGGKYNFGGIFKFDPVTHKTSDVVQFRSYVLPNWFTKTVTPFNNKIYGIVDSMLTTNHTFIFECDPATNSFTIKKSLGDVNLGTNIVPTQPFTILNNKLVSIGTLSGNTVIFSYDVSNNSLSVDYTFPAGFFSNQGISEPLTLLDNTTALLSCTTNSTGVMGTLYRYNYITHTLNQAATLSNMNYPNHYQLTGSLAKMGNKFYGLNSTGIYYTQGPYVYYYSELCYFYSFDNITSNVKIERVEFGAGQSGNGLISDIYKYNNSVYSFFGSDTSNTNVVIRKFNNDKSFQDVVLPNHHDSTFYFQRAYQLQDSLLYYYMVGNTQAWLYKLNLNTMQQALIYTKPFADTVIYDLHKVDGTLYAYADFDASGFSGGNAALCKLVAGNLLPIETNPTTTSYFTDGTAYLYVLDENITTGYPMIYKYDTQNNNTKSLYFDFATASSPGQFKSTRWCRKVGNIIVGYVNYPPGYSPCVFTLNTTNNVLNVDTFYANYPGFPDLTNIRNIDGDVIMCGKNFSNSSSSEFAYHNFVTHQTKTALSFPISGYQNILMFSDSSNVSISAAMQSTCLSSKQVLVANAEVVNATYNWSKNNILMPGATNDTLVIENFTPSDSGYYSCKIGSNWGEISSNVIHLDFDYCNPVYPGDANSDGIVDGADVVQIGLGFGSTGLARSSVSNAYTVYNSNDWMSFAPNNINNKHPDCNGDGAVNFMDTIAVNLNYLQSHPLQITLTPSFNEQEMRVPPIDVKMVASQSAYAPGSAGYVDVVVGNMSSPVNNVYGLYYKIEFDNQVVNNVTINPRLSWLPSASSTKLAAGFVNNSGHVIDGGIVRYNHTDTIGFGTTARIYFNTSNTVFTDIQTAFTIKKIALLNSAALKLPLTVDSLLQFNYGTVTNVDSYVNNSLKMWMYEDIFRVHSKDLISGAIEIYDLQGRLVVKQNMNSFDEMIDLSKEASGMYIAKLSLIDGTSYKKKIIKQ